MFRTSLDVEISAEIERPREDVWALVSNPERLSEWLEDGVSRRTCLACLGTRY